MQALSPIKYHVQYKHSSDRHAAEINGISFRGVHLTPLPAYEEVKSVFVEKAPLHMQDKYLYEALAPYGCVIGVQHLTIKEFPSVRSGTRRVSMVVTKAIPRTINIGGFPVVFNYRGQPTQCYVCQEVGYASKDCPNSRQGRKLQQQQQQQNLPKTTGKNKAQHNTKQSINKANNTKPALGHDDLKIKLGGVKRTVQTTQNKKKSPLGETDLRNKLNKKQETMLKSSETEQAPASKSLPTKSKAGRAKGQSLSKGRSSATDDVNSKDEVARSPKAVAELMDTQPSQETSVLTTSPPAQHLATLRKMFNVPPPSDDELEPGEIRDSSSVQSMDDERSSDHADPKTKLDGSTKSIQLKSEADSPLRVQSHSTSPPLTQQLKQLRSQFNMPATSASESEGITEADFVTSIIEAEQQAAAKSGQVRTAVRTITTLRVRRRQSGPSQAITPATVTTSTSRTSSTITTSTWTGPTGGRAKVTATQAEIDRDDIPLAVLRKNKRRRLNSTTPPDEELDYCLSGSSVIDPLAIEYWQTTPISSFGQTPSLLALEAPSATSDVAFQQQQQQEQQSAEDMSLVPLDGTLAIPATAPVVTILDVARPEPEVTLDPMATPFGALMQEEEEILIQVREEGEVSWASEVASDPRGTPPLIGVEIGILEPGEIGPDPSLIYDLLVVPLSPPGGGR